MGALTSRQLTQILQFYRPPQPFTGTDSILLLNATLLAQNTRGTVHMNYTISSLIFGNVVKSKGSLTVKQNLMDMRN